jgi:hypothetical protein
MMSTDWTDADRAEASERVRQAAELPGVEPEEANGHIGYAVRGRKFAWFQVDHHDDGRLTLCVKTPPGEQQSLIARGGGYFSPAYLGSKGWVGIDLAPRARPDWDEVGFLLEQAWRMTAPKRAVAGLDQRRG